LNATMKNWGNKLTSSQRRSRLSFGSANSISVDMAVGAEYRNQTCDALTAIGISPADSTGGTVGRFPVATKTGNNVLTSKPAIPIPRCLLAAVCRRGRSGDQNS
jgi:hypothetical protein